MCLKLNRFWQLCFSFSNTIKLCVLFLRLFKCILCLFCHKHTIKHTLFWCETQTLIRGNHFLKLPALFNQTLFVHGLTYYSRSEKMQNCNFKLLVSASISLLRWPPSHSVLFHRISATTDFMTDVNNFPANSRVECGSMCYRIMSKNDCTAFALDKLTGMCICGRKLFVPVVVTGSNLELHIKADCNKIRTGWTK